MKFDTLIQKFEYTDRFKRWKEDPKVICVYLGGSRILGASDEKSDYDLVVMTTDSPLIDNAKYFVYSLDDKVLHWYELSPHSFLSESIDSIHSVGLLLWMFMNKDDFLYINPAYSEIVDNWLLYKKRLGVIGGYMLMNHHISEINSLINSPYDAKSIVWKRFYQICTFYYAITETPIDVEFLIRVKRRRYTLDSDVKKMVEILKYISKYCLDNPIDIQYEIAFLRQFLLP